MARSYKLKLKIFAEHFVNIFKPHSDEHDSLIEPYLVTPIETQQMLISATPKEIIDACQSFEYQNVIRPRLYNCINAQRFAKERTGITNIIIQLNIEINPLA